MMKLPRKPTRLEMKWWCLKEIIRHNRMGGVTIFLDIRPFNEEEYKKMHREAEREFRRTHKAEIKERRIGFWKAVKMIWDA